MDGSGSGSASASMLELGAGGAALFASASSSSSASDDRPGEAGTIRGAAEDHEPGALDSGAYWADRASRYGATVEA